VSIEPVDVIHYTDPGCPWAYSAEPYFTTLRYRYGDGLRWRRVMIGLSETHERYDRDGYQPVRSARNRTSFARRFGMPFRFEARPRNMGTGRACRAVKAAERQSDELAEALLRALRFGYFATPLLMDTDEGIAAMARTVDGLDVERVIAEIDDPAVEEAYQRDWTETRTADENGRPGISQGKTANTDGAERFTAPSIVFRRGDRELVAVGWQSLDAYDVCVANLAPELPRRPTPTPAELLPHFPHGLTTQEAAVACTPDLKDVDRESTLRDLVTLVSEGAARRRDIGDDALWLPV
jgi:predicted DsbA family dithiol-disulfide isomerase